MIKLIAFFFFVSGCVGIVTLFWQGAQGGITTALSTTLSANETTAMGVTSTSGFKDSNSRVVVGNEIITYSAKLPAGACPAPIPAGSPCFTGLERGVGASIPASYASGERVYDEATGVANLGVQHQHSLFATDTESGTSVSLNPLTWADAVTSQVSNFVPTFLTGPWAMIQWIFIFFMVIFMLTVALLLTSLVRGVRLF